MRVPPPDFSRRATVDGFPDDDSIDDESYVQVPRDLHEPSIHHAPSMRRAMPAVHRQDYPYDPSVHDFGTAEEEYSDFGEGPLSDTTRYPVGGHSSRGMAVDPVHHDRSNSGNPRYPMGGYSGRDMVEDPLDPSVIARTDSMDSQDNDHYVEDGRRHPAFSRTSSHACDFAAFRSKFTLNNLCHSRQTQYLLREFTPPLQGRIGRVTRSLLLPQSTNETWWYVRSHYLQYISLSSTSARSTQSLLLPRFANETWWYVRFRCLRYIPLKHSQG